MNPFSEFIEGIKQGIYIDAQKRKEKSNTPIYKQTMNTVTVNYADTDHASIEIKGEWATLSVFSKGSTNKVELSVDEEENNGGVYTLMLNQEEIKVLINHLQKQLI